MTLAVKQNMQKLIKPKETMISPDTLPLRFTQQSVSECFFVEILCFRKVAEPSKVPRLSAKTVVRPFALWVALEPQKTLKMCRFQGPLDVRLALE